jgi:hypothetical protein
LINWADSSVTFQDHPDTLLVTTTQSVLANQEELPSDDDTPSELSEDLPDPNPVDIPEPTTEFISNPTVDLIPISGITLVSVTTLIPNEYRQSSNSSVSGSQVQDSKTTQNAYC